MVSLSWIRSSPHKWKAFVVNRISTIHDNPLTIPGIMCHFNIASCGEFPSSLLTTLLWCAGPQWIRQTTDNWPSLSHKSLEVS